MCVSSRLRRAAEADRVVVTAGAPGAAAGLPHPRRLPTTSDPDVRLLAALADPIRLRIVRQLADAGSVCVCDLDACQSVSQPTVSHHLRILREAGVVRAERRGTWVYYSLEPAVFDRLAAILRSIQPPSPVAPAAASRPGAEASAATRTGAATGTGGSRGGRGRRLPVVEPPEDR
jgi:ArsR family transcriptional regulator